MINKNREFYSFCILAMLTYSWAQQCNQESYNNRFLKYTCDIPMQVSSTNNYQIEFEPVKLNEIMEELGGWFYPGDTIRISPSPNSKGEIIVGTTSQTHHLHQYTGSSRKWYGRKINHYVDYYDTCEKSYGGRLTSNAFTSNISLHAGNISTQNVVASFLPLDSDISIDAPTQLSIGLSTGINATANVRTSSCPRAGAKPQGSPSVRLHVHQGDIPFSFEITVLRLQ